MSRGYDFEERDDGRAAQENPSRVVNNLGRTGSPKAPKEPLAELARDQGRRHERGSPRAVKRSPRLSDRERGTPREIGRFRAISSESF